MTTKTWRKPILLLMVLAMALCACAVGLSALSARAVDDAPDLSAYQETKLTGIGWLNNTDVITLRFSAGESSTQKPNFEGNVGKEGYEDFTDNLLLNGLTLVEAKTQGIISGYDVHANWGDAAAAHTLYLGLKSCDFKFGTTITLKAGFRRPMFTDPAWTLENHAVKSDITYYYTGNGPTTMSAWKLFTDESFEINVSKLDAMYVGQEMQVRAKLPADATDVTYESSDDTVARVDATGKVTAVAVGSATITVTRKGVQKTIPVGVIDAPMSIRRIYGQGSDSNVVIIAFNHNETSAPKTGFEANLSDAAFAAFTDNLLLDGKKLTEYADKIAIDGNTGRNPSVYDYSVEGRANIRLTLKDDLKFEYGTTLTFKQGFKRPVATADGWALEDYAFASDETHYLSVSKMTEAPADWKQATADDLILNMASVQIKPADEIQLKVKVPLEATGITYSSANTGVATVDATGKIVGVADGTTTVTATDGTHTADVEVIVTGNPFNGTEFKFDPSRIAYVGIENYACFESEYYRTIHPTADIEGEIAGVEVQPNGASYKDEKFGAFYDHILINGMTYKQAKAKFGDAYAPIRLFGGGNAGEPMRIGFQSKKADIVVTFLRGFQPLKYSKTNGWAIDEDYMLLESITLRSRNDNGAWAKLTQEVGVVYTAEPTSLKVGDTGSVAAYAMRPYSAPAAAGDVHFTSSDTTVLTIDEVTGAYTVLKGGEVKIIATYGTVHEDLTYEIASAVSLDETEISLRGGATKQLTATVASSSNLTLDGAVWSTSDETVATVADGLVTAVAEGTAVITITLSNGDTATCNVSVANADTLTISADKTDINFSQEIKLTATTNSSAEIAWSISESAGSFTPAKGKATTFKPRKSGAFTITATLEGTEVVQTVDITVVATVAFTAASEKIKAGETYTLTTEVQPSTMEVTYLSSNETVATVSDTGVITGVKKGKATITATTADNQTAEFKITVYEMTATTVQRALMTDGATLQILFSASPFTDTAAPWTNMENVAKSDTIPEPLEAFFSKVKINGQNFMEFWANQDRGYDVNMHLGQVAQLMNLPCHEFRSNGSTSKNYPKGTTLVLEAGLPLPEKINNQWRLSEYYLDRTYIFETIEGATSATDLSEATVGTVSFTESSVTIEKGATKTLELTATGNRYALEYVQVTYTSSVPAIATVDEHGVVTAVSAGTATITATVGSSNISVNVTVTDSGTTEPDPDKPDPEKPDGGKKKGGCGGNLGATSVGAAFALLALGFGFVSYKKRKNTRA